MRVKGPAAQSHRFRCPQANCPAPRHPEGEIIAAANSEDGAEHDALAVVAEAWHALVDGLIVVAQPDSHRLSPLQAAPVNVYAVPGEVGALIWRGRECLLGDDTADRDPQANLSE